MTVRSDACGSETQISGHLRVAIVPQVTNRAYLNIEESKTMTQISVETIVAPSHILPISGEPFFGLYHRWQSLVASSQADMRHLTR